MGSCSNNGTVLITGAASGIGREVAFTFAENGASAIVFADIDVNGARETAQECASFATNPKFRTLALEVDVTSEESVGEMVRKAVAEFGEIDVGVNSAGVFGRPSSVKDLNMQEFDRVYNVNVRGTAIGMNAMMQQMAMQESISTEGRNGPRTLGRGCIVNLASIASYIVGPKSAAYTTSKHAVLGLTKAAALDGIDDGIRVNAVCPSFVSTPMTAPMVEKAGARMKSMLGKIGRMAVPEEVAGAVLYLCSPAASYVNGTGMIIDAGMSLNGHVG